MQEKEAPQGEGSTSLKKPKSELPSVAAFSDFEAEVTKLRGRLVEAPQPRFWLRRRPFGLASGLSAALLVAPQGFRPRFSLRRRPLR